MGSTNLIKGVLRNSVSAAVVALVDTDLGPLQCSFASPFAAGTRVTISVRPENIKIAAEMILNGANILEGQIKDHSVCLGMADYSVDVRGIELFVRSAVNGRAFSGSETVQLQLTPDKCVVVSTDKGDQGHETAATD